MTALLDGWISEPLFLLTLTVGVYWGAVTLYRARAGAFSTRCWSRWWSSSSS